MPKTQSQNGNLEMSKFKVYQNCTKWVRVRER